MSTPVEAFKAKFKAHPVRSSIIIVLTIVLTAAWLQVGPKVESRAATDPDALLNGAQQYDGPIGSDLSEAPGPDEQWSEAGGTAPLDNEVYDKACPRDDPCSLSKRVWVSPERMFQRFKNGSLGNARGRTLPIRIQRMATHKWNQNHKMADVEAEMSGKGCSHWWCKPLSVASCTINIYLCAGRSLGWSNMRSIGFRCGGSALIVGTGTGILTTPFGGLVGATTTASACTYQSIGHIYGWW